MTDFWRDKRVLISGMGGFLGSRLARVLMDRGASVWGIDLYSNMKGLRAWGLGEPRLRHADITQPSVMQAAFMDLQPKVYFHLAGQSHINASQASPLPALEINVRGAYLALEAARQYGKLEAMVVSSSNHVYGNLAHTDRKNEPWCESDPLDAADIYGASKACADHLTRAYGRTLGLPTVALRHANTYGPGDPHASHIVTGAVLSVLRGERPRLRGNGRGAKGYLYLDDTVAAYLRCAEVVGVGDLGGLVYNAGPDWSVAAGDLAQAVMDVAGLEGHPEIGDSYEQHDYYEALDSSDLHASGWRPEVGLVDGLRRTLAWYREHPDFCA